MNAWTAVQAVGKEQQLLQSRLCAEDQLGLHQQGVLRGARPARQCTVCVEVPPSAQSMPSTSEHPPGGQRGDEGGKHEHVQAGGRDHLLLPGVQLEGWDQGRP